MTQPVRPSPTIPTFRQALVLVGRILALIRPQWPALIRGTLLGLLIGLVGLVTPYFTKIYFDNVYPSHDFSLLQVVVIAATIFSLSNTIMGAVRNYYSQVISARLSNGLGLMYFNHIQHLPVRFFDERRVG